RMQRSGIRGTHRTEPVPPRIPFHSIRATTLKPAVAPVAGCRLPVAGCRLSVVGKGRGFRRSYATGRSAAHHGHHPQERRRPRPFPRPPTTPPVRAHLPTPPAEHTPARSRRNPPTGGARCHHARQPTRRGIRPTRSEPRK